ncbi:MAG: hypothetical protein OXF88_03325 [Rhodobacteraceae bacterium]|nr:hypothetical protein [Paracoccaceae bacterium]
MTSFGGAMLLLLPEAGRLPDVTRRLATCLADLRDQRHTEHSVAGTIAQRVKAWPAAGASASAVMLWRNRAR